VFFWYNQVRFRNREMGRAHSKIREKIESLDSELKMEFQKRLELQTKYRKDATPQEREALEQSLLAQAEAAKKAFEHGLDVACINIGFIGLPGVGKSSLVNSMVGSTATARTGVVETTHEPQQFPMPEFPSLRLWDIPGGGTDQHRMETYFEDNFLQMFDELVIVTGKRLTQFDIDFAKLAKEHGTKVTFARSKTDEDISNTFYEMSNGGDIHYAAEEDKKQVVEHVKTEVKANYTRQLADAGLGEIKFYQVSSRTMRSVIQSGNTSVEVVDEEKMALDVFDAILIDRFQKAKVVRWKLFSKGVRKVFGKK